ncbi:MAG: carbohydrate-binding domain-containing protein [Lachnospiraceae bacterium]|nr:carbohydrate-binding domain-containing protein [Lachnospiraceae bacterium]
MRSRKYWQTLREAGKKAGIVCLALIFAGTYVLEGNAQENMSDTADENASEEINADAERTAATEKTVDTYIDEENAVQVTLADDGSTVSGSGASVSGNVITISEEGSYWFTGSLSDGQILVDVDGDETVVLMLAGVEITNPADAAIYVENADRAIVYLVDGTKNQIVSGEDTGSSAADGEVDDTAEGGAIWAKDDLMIGGSGSLTVKGFLNNGIQTSNDLTIEDGTITVDAVNNGIKGKDSVTILGGTITVTAGGDGIKSDDDTGDGYGVVTIEEGEIQIESGEDGIQAETLLTISGGTIQITSGGGSAEAGTASATSVTGGWTSFFSGWDMEDEDTESMKGIKAGSEMQITGGTILVDSYDDSIHSNGTITILDGSITVSSGDDGVHADTELTISDGTIVVSQSYEGLEGNQIRIEGGNIQVTATDDGINANGGSDSWGRGMMGAGNGMDSNGDMGINMNAGTNADTGTDASEDFVGNTSENVSENASETTPWLLITGGTIWVNAQGDGLDSNADLTIEGGTIIVDGPSDSSNGSIDYGSENGGSCTISGGTVLAIGASGMAETFGSSSTQCSFMLSLSSNYAAGSVITICDAEGNVLFEHTSERAFSSIIYSSADLEEDGTYQIMVDSDTTEITLTSVTGSYSWSGESTGTGGFGNFGGQMGGGRKGNRMDDSQMDENFDDSQMPDDSQIPDNQMSDNGDMEQMSENTQDSQPSNVGGNGQMV